jgi:hypothetical protein
MKPEGILNKLASADRAWQRTTALEHMLRAVKFIIAAVLIAVALDLILQLASGVRLGMTLLGITAVLAFIGLLSWRAFFCRSPLLRVARLLESRDATLGTKLINILQLDDEARDESKPELTRKLARRAVDEAGEVLDKRDFRPLTKSRTLEASATWALVTVAALLLPLLFFFQIAAGELLRFLDPFGDHPAFSFTSLRITSPEDAVKVIYKKPVVVEVDYSGHRPSELFLSVEGEKGQPHQAPLYPMGDKKFTQQIDEVTSDLVVYAHTKSQRSVSQQRRISVVLTPQLEKASVTVQPPAYTKLPPRMTDFTANGGTPANLTALAGSTMTFRFTSNRPLNDGTLVLQGADPKPESQTLTRADEKTENVVTGSLTAAESGRLRFEIRDVTGLPNDREMSAALTVTHDLPPEITLTEPQQDGFIVDTFAANVAFRATDDYGLKNIRLHTAIDGKFSEPKVIEAQAIPPQRDAFETVRIEPVKMGAKPGSVISVFGEATDIRPEPQMSRSRTLKLEVISEEQYNDYLRTRTEIADLEAKYKQFNDALRELAKEQHELAKKADAAQKAEPNQKQRDELAASQAELNEKLDKLAERMTQSTREKPLYDLEKELQKVLDKEAEEVRDSIAQNEKALSNFAQSQPSQKSTGEFKDEAQAQAERLDPALAEGEKKIQEALADAQKMQELVKPLSAYAELYKRQKELAEQTAAYKDKPQLNEEDRLALQNMAADERLISEALQKVADSLKEAAVGAEKEYPETAQDARDIAKAIEDAQLPSLADQSARTMMAAKGAESHDRAEHVREEMDKLISKCSNCKPGMGGELAMRLKLSHSMAAGSTFDQIMQCKKFGMGKGGSGGGGQGFGGMFADGSTGGTQQSLLGGETMLGHADKESATTSNATANGTPSPGADKARDGKTGDKNGITSSARPAQSGKGDAVLGEYEQLVEAYFRRLTTEKKKP